MKKTPALLLALSLLANVVLAISLHRANGAAPSAAARSATAASRTSAATDAAIADAMRAGDASALIDRLKAAGISEKTARYMAASLELQKFADQMTALMPEQPYWRSRGPRTPEQRMKMQQIMRSFQTTMNDLLGDVMPQLGNNRHAYLTPERRAELRQLEKDYDDLKAETLAASGNFLLQSDSDNLKSLAEERKREIDRFLTPDEIAARDLRESPAARQIRNDYGIIIENEAEYQSIHATLAAAGDDPAAQAAAREQIESMLGSERMAKLARLNDPDYELIQSAATRLNLPLSETTTSLTAIRAEAQQASAGIIADKSLTPAQRKAALQSIAEQSRAQMDGVLGSEGAETYSKSSQWMRALKNGSAFAIDERGKLKPKK